MNKEIWNYKGATAAIKSQDLKYQKTPKPLVKGIVPMVAVIDRLISCKGATGRVDVKLHAKVLLETLQLIMSAIYEINY